MFATPKGFFLFFILGAASTTHALPAEVSPFHTKRKKPNVDLKTLAMAKRIEALAKISVGFVSRSHAPAGLKCADQVSQILWLAEAENHISFAVEALIELRIEAGWKHSPAPRSGCLIYSFQEMPISRSHVGIVIENDKSLKEALTRISADYNKRGQENLNEFIETQKQLPFVNGNDQRLLISKLEDWSKGLRPKSSKRRLDAREQHQLISQVLRRFEPARGTHFTIVHNHIAALREGPFDMEDVQWMAKARFLCPGN